MPQVRAITAFKVKELGQWLAGVQGKDIAWKAHYQFALAQLKDYDQSPEKWLLPGTLPVPDGAPIGAAEENWLLCH